MPTFDTPAPITLVVDVGAADVRIVADERTETTVEIRPADTADESDVAAAREIAVDFTGGTVHVTGPRSRLFTRRTRSVDIAVALPMGSAAAARLQVGGVSAVGRLGDCDMTVAAGNVRLEQIGKAQLKASAGHVSADSVLGDAVVSTGSGRVHIGQVDGSATIDNANGHVVLDAVTGAATLRTANGDLQLGRAGGDVVAKTSNGSVRVDEVVGGAVELATAMGDVEIGVAEGTAAWLDVHTSFGQLHTELDGAARPTDSDATVEIHARTSYGDITVRRAAARSVR